MNKHDDINQSATLHVAVCSESLACVQTLITLKVDVNCTDSDGQTPLILACRKFLTVIAAALIKGGSDVNHKDDIYGESALHSSSEIGDIDVVNYLIKNGADVESATKTGETALWIAVVNDQESIATILLESGNANPCLADKENVTLLHMMASKNMLELVKLAFEYGIISDINVQERICGNTPLHIAAELSLGSDQMCSTFIDHDADLTITNKYGQTPADVVIELGHLESFAIFGLEDFFTPVINKNHDELAAVLNTTNRPDINWTNNSSQGETALHAAAKNGDEYCINCLLSYGADVDIPNSMGQSPLYTSIRKGHFNVAMTLLLEGNGDPNIGTEYGFSCLVMAVKRKSEALFELMLSHGGDLKLIMPPVDGCRRTVAQTIKSMKGIGERILKLIDTALIEEQTRKSTTSTGRTSSHGSSLTAFVNSSLQKSSTPQQRPSFGQEDTLMPESASIRRNLMKRMSGSAPRPSMAINVISPGIQVPSAAPARRRSILNNNLRVNG